MDKSVVVALISGTFSTFSALGAVFLKDWLEARRLRRAQQKMAESVVVTPGAASAPAAASPPLTRGPSMPPMSAVPVPSAERAVPARASSRMRPVFVVVGSVLFGMLTRAMRPMIPGPFHVDALIALVVIVAFVLWLAIDHRRRGGVIAFELENLAVWSGWSCGWLLIHGQIWGDLLSVAVLWWFGCAVVGAAIVAIRSRVAAVAETA